MDEENLVVQHLLPLSNSFHLSLHLLKDVRSACVRVQSDGWSIYSFDTFSIINKEVCSTMVGIIGYVVDIHNKKKWS